MLRSIAEVELLPVRLGSDPLSAFELESRRKVCKILVSDVHSDTDTLMRATNERPQLEWLLEVLSHSLSLPFSSAHSSTNSTMMKALDIYGAWIMNGSMPPCIESEEDRHWLRCRIFENVSLLFETKREGTSASATATARNRMKDMVLDHHVDSPLELCQRALRLYEVAIKKIPYELLTETWEHLLRVLIGVADGLLSPPENDPENAIGDALTLQLVHLVIGGFLASMAHTKIGVELWNLLPTFVKKWSHRQAVVASWHSIVSSMTDLLLYDMRAQHKLKFERIKGIERKVTRGSSFALNELNKRSSSFDGERTTDSSGSESTPRVKFGNVYASEPDLAASLREESTAPMTRGRSRVVAETAQITWWLRAPSVEGQKDAMPTMSFSAPSMSMSGPPMPMSASTGDGNMAEIASLVVAASDGPIVVQLNQPNIHFAWIRFVHLIGNPNRILIREQALAAPLIHREAIRVVCHLSAMLLGDADYLGHDPTISPATPITSPGSTGMRQQSARLSRAISGFESTDPYMGPHANAILRLLGAWLFDTALNNRPEYGVGRSLALLALGKVICTPRRHAGRVPPYHADYSGPRISVEEAHSSRVLAPHISRYLMALRRALSTSDGAPEAVIAVLRGSNGLIGADVHGSRLLVREMNFAVSKVLKMHSGHSTLEDFYPRTALAPPPPPTNTTKSKNMSFAVAPASIPAGPSTPHPTGDVAMEDIFYSPNYPLRGWLAQRFDIDSAMKDFTAQRTWCLLTLASEVCLPTHFGDAVQRYLDTFGDSELDIKDDAQTENLLRESMYKLMQSRNNFRKGGAGKKNERRDMTLKIADFYKDLRPDLIGLIRESLNLSARSTDSGDRENLMGSIWLLLVAIQDAAISRESHKLLASTGLLMQSLWRDIVEPFLSKPPQQHQLDVCNVVISGLSGLIDIEATLHKSAPDIIRKCLAMLCRFTNNLARATAPPPAASPREEQLKSRGYKKSNTISEDAQQALGSAGSGTSSNGSGVGGAIGGSNSDADATNSTNSTNSQQHQQGGGGSSFGGGSVVGSTVSGGNDEGKAHIREQSVHAAATLSRALECLRLWAVGAPWTVLDNNKVAETKDRTSPKELLALMSDASLTCGAFVATPVAVSEFEQALPPTASGSGNGNNNNNGRRAARKSYSPRHVASTATSHLEGLPPTSLRVGMLATQLLESLSRLLGEYPTSNGPSCFSSLVTENRALSAFGEANEIASARKKFCRYVLVNRSTLLTLVEYTHPTNSDDTLLVIARDGLGRYSWVVRCMDLLDPQRVVLANAAKHLLKRRTHPTSLTSTDDGDEEELSMWSGMSRSDDGELAASINPLMSSATRNRVESEDHRESTPQVEPEKKEEEEAEFIPDPLLRMLYTYRKTYRRSLLTGKAIMDTRNDMPLEDQAVVVKENSEYHARNHSGSYEIDPAVLFVKKGPLPLKEGEPSEVDEYPVTCEAEEQEMLRRLLPTPNTGDGAEEIVLEALKEESRLDEASPSSFYAAEEGFPKAQRPKLIDLKPSNCFMQKTRLFMSQALSAFTPDSYGRLQILENCEDCEKSIQELDAQAERDQHVVWLVFARNRRQASHQSERSSTVASTAKDKNEFIPTVEIVAPKSQDETEDEYTQSSLPVDWHLFLTGDRNPVPRMESKQQQQQQTSSPAGTKSGGLGSLVTGTYHHGYCGDLDLKNTPADMPFLYHADAKDEVVFYDCTRPARISRSRGESMAPAALLKEDFLWGVEGEYEPVLSPPTPSSMPPLTRTHSSSSSVTAAGGKRSMRHRRQNSDASRASQAIGQQTSGHQSSGQQASGQQTSSASDGGPVRDSLIDNKVPSDARVGVNSTVHNLSVWDKKPVIMVIWNDCCQQFSPQRDEWRIYGISARAHVYIIIDPLSASLYRTRIYTGDGVALSAGTLGPHCLNRDLLGPLQHGMVVSQALLGPLVRRTAVNASKAVLDHWRATGKLTEPTCPYHTRVKSLNGLRKHAHPALNESFGAFLRASLAPMPDKPLGADLSAHTLPPTFSVPEESTTSARAASTSVHSL